MSKIDLHMHSNHSSDGEFAPAELIRLAANAGLCCVALADHNSVAGVSEMHKAGRAAGVSVIPAIEIDCTYMGRIFHVLGYNIDHTMPEFHELEKRVSDMENTASIECIRLINELGIPVTLDNARAFAPHGGSIVPENIAEAALNDPALIDNELLKPYRAGGERGDNPLANFFWDMCAQDKPAHVPMDYMSLDNAVALIASAGGVPVLAHPGNNLRGRMELLNGIIASGIRGIEAYSSYHTSEECETFADIAREAGLIITGGSDFHGKAKPNVQMGEFGLSADGLSLITKLTEASGG